MAATADPKVCDYSPLVTNSDSRVFPSFKQISIEAGFGGDLSSVLRR